VYTTKGSMRLYVRASDLPNLLRAFQALLPGRVVLPHGAEHKWYRRKKETKDLSQRRPYRSRAVSLGIKLVSIGILMGSAAFLISTNRWGYAVLLYVLLAALLQVANGLNERDPAKLLGSDRRRPILYLRSFLDDRRTSLIQKHGFLALSDWTLRCFHSTSIAMPGSTDSVERLYSLSRITIQSGC
jgi:hypothetical protein